MFFLFNILVLVLFGWNLLSAGVGALFGNYLLGIIIGDTWMVLSFVVALLVGTVIRKADEREGVYHHPYGHNSRYAV